MIIYIIKLILILVFNIGINIYYINSGCKCCGNSCKPNKNNSGGGIQGDKFAIDLDNNTLKRNGNRLQGFKKIKTEDLASINPQRVINGKFENDQNIYYTIDETIFNSIKEDSNVEIIKNSNSDTYIVFAVKTQVNGFDKVNPKYDYYIVYCDDGSTVDDCGLFEEINTNVEIKILGSGNNLTDISYMFYDCKNLEKITFNPTCFNTNKVTNMYYMFYECNSLTSLDVSSFNTSNVTNMYGMFYLCNSLTSLDVSSFNTSKVTNMNSMFYGCNSLTSLDVSSFNTGNVTNMAWMFAYCSSLTELNLSNFDTSRVTDIGYMFYRCTNLTSLILHDKVINDGVTKSYENMFAGCGKLKKGKVTTKDEIILNMFKS